MTRAERLRGLLEQVEEGIELAKEQQMLQQQHRAGVLPEILVPFVDVIKPDELAAELQGLRGKQARIQALLRKLT
jgi:hypothetical protein